MYREINACEHGDVEQSQWWQQYRKKRAAVSRGPRSQTLIAILDFLLNTDLDSA